MLNGLLDATFSHGSTTRPRPFPGTLHPDPAPRYNRRIPRRDLRGKSSTPDVTGESTPIVPIRAGVPRRGFGHGDDGEAQPRNHQSAPAPSRTLSAGAPTGQRSTPVPPQE